jgi:AraC-like DNA-binding protein
MNDTGNLRFVFPPIPHFISCGTGTYAIGEGHSNRARIGVFDLIIVHRGALHLGEEKQKWTVSEGECIILRPDLHHFATAPCRQETHIYWIHFQTSGLWEESQGEFRSDAFSDYNHTNRDLFATYNYSLRIPRHIRFPYPSNAYRALQKLLELEQQPLASARWWQQTIFEDFIREELDLEQSVVNDQRIVRLAEQIATFLRQNYKSQITNSSLHEQFHFHPNYIARCMKTCFGRTALEYLLYYRIEQAKVLLLRNTWPVTRIAEELGFLHISHFTKCFKKIEGISPSQFRKQFTNEKAGSLSGNN